MGTIAIMMPPQLMEAARKADAAGDLVKLPTEQVRGIAEMWFRDQEKIKYLESLLLRKDR